MRTREALHRALLELLEVRPLDQITILDICAVAQIGYTTFFRHHPSKEALLEHLAAEEIERLVALTLPVIDASVRAASETLFAYVDARRQLWSTLLTGGAAGTLRAEMLRLAIEIAATRTLPKDWPAAEVATRVFVSGTIEILTWWLQQARPMPLADVAELHKRIVALPIIGNRQKMPAPVAAAATAKRSRK